jgi:hypothetical protein
LEAAPPGSVCATVAVFANSRSVTHPRRSTATWRIWERTLTPPPNPIKPSQTDVRSSSPIEAPDEDRSRGGGR